jgi:hypothetical protein
MKNIIDHQFSKIQKIVDEKEEQLEVEQFDKYYTIYTMVCKMLEKQPVLLYGGLAINELLPDKLKIYKKKSLPDIDIFSKNPESTAKKVVDYFQKHGYPVASYGDALHEGTFKVYVHGNQVLDISAVSASSFKKLSKNSVRGSLGIKVVNPQFLRMSFHMILSQPNDAHRWTKTFERLVAFYKTYPPSTKCLLSSTNINSNVYDSINNYIKTIDCILFGFNELHLFKENLVSKDHTIIKDFPTIQILVTNDIYEVAIDLIEKIGDPLLSVGKVYEADDFIPRHIFILYKKQKIMGIYTANSCMSYIQVNNQKVASIHTIIRMYYLMLFSSYSHFEKYYSKLECLVNILSVLQYKNIGRNNKMFKEFISECYGMHKGLITLKREKLQKYIK